MRINNAITITDELKELTSEDTSVILLDSNNNHILTVIVKPNGEIARFNDGETTLLINGKVMTSTKYLNN